MVFIFDNELKLPVLSALMSRSNSPDKGALTKSGFEYELGSYELQKDFGLGRRWS
jgi:hypothetical protein